MKSLFEVTYHFENVPYFMQIIMRTEFTEHRSEVVKVFNDHIDEVNRQWDLTGKPAAFGKYIEDINPEYVEFVKEQIQPKIDIVNEQFPIVKYCIDEVGDLVGYLPGIKKSKIYITLKKI